jgi:hypothetical protein
MDVSIREPCTYHKNTCALEPQSQKEKQNCRHTGNGDRSTEIRVDSDRALDMFVEAVELCDICSEGSHFESHSNVASLSVEISSLNTPL